MKGAMMGYDIVSLIPAFCAAFLGLSDFEEGGIVVWDQIDLTTYDYSVASLEQVDLYLGAVREVKDQLKQQTYTNTVLATGAYVGEVIRRQGNKHWEWMNYADFAAKYPELNSAMELEEDLYSAAILTIFSSSAPGPAVSARAALPPGMAPGWRSRKNSASAAPA
jgi:hypothetical protein